jgi:hypothetical protein
MQIFAYRVELKNSGFVFVRDTAIVSARHNLGAAKFGDSLGSFRDSVLGKFTREHETDSSLDLSAAQSRLLVVRGKLSGFRGNALKDIVDEGVHDGHALLGDTRIRVNLLEDLVNVRRVRLDTLLGTGRRRLLRGLLGRGFGRCLGHFGK